MSKLGTRWGWLSAIVIGGVYISSAHCAFAQITPDGTLPNNSIVTPSGNIINITGGTQAGSNLFHSFKDFSVPTGSEAFFNNTVDIGNIISRVTGGSISNIDGFIRANGTANLFLINPNGIVFGPNARLNIGGSFIGSTASSLKFADGTEFSATNPGAPPLLTISVPLGLQFGSNPKEIQVNGPGHEFSYEEKIVEYSSGSKTKESAPALNSNVPGLEVGKTLALVGGNVSISGGVLKSPAGRIEIGGVDSNQAVSLMPIEQGWKLGYEGTTSFADIGLREKSFIGATGDGGGAIAIAGRNINISSESIVRSDTQGNRNGQQISILGDAIDVDRSNIGANSFSSGNGGQIKLEANNITLNNNGTAQTQATASGSAGDITVIAKNDFVVSNNGGLVSKSSSGATGNGGAINIKANSFYVNNTGLTSYNYGTGDAGTITIDANKVQISDGGIDSSASASGKSGDIFINTRDSFTVSRGGINANIYGTGDAGTITIDANKVQIELGVINSSASASGKSGDISINARDSFTAINAGIYANSLATGDAGTISITAKNAQIESAEVSSNTQNTGKAGEINFKVTDSFDLKSANINTNTSGEANGGRIYISAKKLQMQDASIRSDASNTGRGGDIDLQIGNLLLLRGQNSFSSISTTATGSGNGGNININIPNGFIVTVPNENSDISADAFSGGGGKIIITSLSNFGIQQRSRDDLSRQLETTDPNQLKPVNSVTNDITAFSQTSPVLEGQVTDPSKGFVQQPTTLLAEISEVIDTSCAAFAEGQGSKFTVTGRGGLPPTPYEPLSTDVVWTDTRTTAITTQQQGKKEPADLPQSKPEAIKIVPATGWVFNGKGQVTLISHASNPNGMGTTPASCPKR